MASISVCPHSVSPEGVSNRTLPPWKGADNKAVFHPNGFVQNLPQGMVNDQFELAAFIIGHLQQYTTHAPFPDEISEEIKKEMDSLGVKNYTSYLHKPSEPKVVSESAPVVVPEYLVAHRMIKAASSSSSDKDKQPDDMEHMCKKNWSLKAKKFSDDLLFYVFYTFTRDLLQLIAANQLYENGWRYHRGGQVWIQPLAHAVYVKDVENRLERGYYRLFDYNMWKIIQKELCVGLGEVEASPSALYPDFLLNYV